MVFAVFGGAVGARDGSRGVIMECVPWNYLVSNYY
jgi:hypothetical protein